MKVARTHSVTNYIYGWTTAGVRGRTPHMERVPNNTNGSGTDSHCHELYIQGEQPPEFAEGACGRRPIVLKESEMIKRNLAVLVALQEGEKLWVRAALVCDAFECRVRGVFYPAVLVALQEGEKLWARNAFSCRVRDVFRLAVLVALLEGQALWVRDAFVTHSYIEFVTHSYIEFVQHSCVELVTHSIWCCLSRGQVRDSSICRVGRGRVRDSSICKVRDSSICRVDDFFHLAVRVARKYKFVMHSWRNSYSAFVAHSYMFVTHCIVWCLSTGRVRDAFMCTLVTCSYVEFVTHLHVELVTHFL